MNAAANTDPNAPADSPTSKRTRRKPDPEPERRTPPARRPKAGQPDPEEGRIQRRNPPDPAIDLAVNSLMPAAWATSLRVVAGRHPVVHDLVGGVETVGYRVRVGA